MHAGIHLYAVRETVEKAVETVDWFTNMQLAEDAGTAGTVSSVPILPIGTFDTSAHAHLPKRLTISHELAETLVENFDKRVGKVIPFVDDGKHAEDKAAGWIVGLHIGEFPHAVTGDPIPGLIADVEWTSLGESMLADKQYRYVSALFAPYHDEETGKDYTVLRSVTPTNKPVMKMLPEISLAEPAGIIAGVRSILAKAIPALQPVDVVEFAALSEWYTEGAEIPEGGNRDGGDALALGEITDAMAERMKRRKADQVQWPVMSGMYEATDVLQDKVRALVGDGATGDDLVRGISELCADLPAGILMGMRTAVAQENERRAKARAEGNATDTEPITDPTAGTNAPAAILPDDGLSSAVVDLTATLADAEGEDAEAILAALGKLFTQLRGMAKGKAGVRAMQALHDTAMAKAKQIMGATTAKGVKLEMGDKIRLHGQIIMLSEDMPEETRTALEAAAKAEADEQRKGVDAALDAASAKGMPEPMRAALSAIADADADGIVSLSEGQDSTMAQAVIAAAAAYDHVPVTPSGEGATITQPAQTVELSEAESEVARQMGNDPEAVKAHKGDA